MNKPFFSVIIPTLNEEHYIGRLLENLTKQHETAFEVLVIDGGSNDKTIEEVQSFKKQLPLTFITANRANVSHQRNLGARRSRGQYLVFTDADVQISPEFLSKIKKYIKTRKVSYLTTHVKPDSSYLYDWAVVQLHNLTMDVSALVRRPFVGGYNFIVRKSVFAESGGFNETIVHAEDWELSERLHRAGHRLTILSHPLLTYSLRRFRHEGRITVLRKNTAASLYVLLHGHITKAIFSYPMGGAAYQKPKKPSSQVSRGRQLPIE